MKETNSYKKGLTSGFPICIGYFSVSFAFGIFSIQNGLTVFEAFLISLTNLTSAGQLAGVPIIAGGGTLLELAATQLVINSRYALMSISLSQKLGKSVKLFDRFILAHGNTDEIFAIATSNSKNVGNRYMYGLMTLPIVGWTCGTLLGALAGDVLPDSVSEALGVAIYGMFVAIVVPAVKKEKSMLWCVTIALATSCLFRYSPYLTHIPSGFAIILCSCIASAIAAIIFPVENEVASDEA